MVKLNSIADLTSNKRQGWKQGSLTEGEGSLQLTSLYQLVEQFLFIVKILFTFFTKQATLIRRSTVLSLPPQLVFPGGSVRRILYLFLSHAWRLAKTRPSSSSSPKPTFRTRPPSRNQKRSGDNFTKLFTSVIYELSY